MSFFVFEDMNRDELNEDEGAWKMVKIIFGIAGLIGGGIVFVVWCCAKIGSSQDHEK